VRLLLLAFAVALGPLARGQAPAFPPDYTRELDAPPDGLFRNSARLAGVEEAYLPALYATSDAANLLRLKTGEILCTWSSGAADAGADAGIMFSRLPYDDKRWDAPLRVDHAPGQAYRNPVPFAAPDGRLWIFHTSREAGPGLARSQVLVTQSVDDGGSWSDPTVLADTEGAVVRQPILATPDGRWLLPMDATPAGIPRGTGRDFSLIRITRNGGVDWTTARVPRSQGCVQPNVLRLLSGRFLALFRSRYSDFIYQSASADGFVWTVPRPTVLPNNNASVQAAVLGDGNFVLAFNNASSGSGGRVPKLGPRKPLSIALSDDEGQHWRWVRDLETGGPGPAAAAAAADQPGGDDYSSPSLLQGADDKIYVAYTYRHYTIKIVRFDEGWIKGGKSAGTFRGEGAR
jgi:predicted neuraminidase